MIPAGITLRLIAIVIILAIVISAVAAIRANWIRQGRDAEAARVTRQNQEAGNAAENARSRFDAGCPDGLRWRSATGQCERSSVSGGG